MNGRASSVPLGTCFIASSFKSGQARRSRPAQQWSNIVIPGIDGKQRLWANSSRSFPE